MPANRRSLSLVDAYRRRLRALSDRATQDAERRWPRIEELDGTSWAEDTAASLTRIQSEGVRLTAGFLAAFHRSEKGQGRTPSIAAGDYVGKSRDGRSLDVALRSPLIGVLAALKQGDAPDKALSLGLNRARRMVAFEAMQTPRDALVDTIDADERFERHERAVAGTCAACMALSGSGGPKFEVHPGCECIPMPVVTGVAQRIALPTGAALFTALTKAEQDKTLGAEAAQLVRDGAPLKDFVSHSRQEEQADFLTQKPAEQVAT